jgi:transcription elongation factor Elf1
MELKSYTCPHCGGVLIVKEQLKVYRCEYCGVTYDYDYFKEEDLLARADVYLKKKEFLAAKEAYGFLLEKEPDNAKAYKRLLLVTEKFTDLHDFRYEKIYDNLHFPELKAINDRALKEVTGKDRVFFEAFERSVLTHGSALVEARKKYNEQKDVCDNLALEKSRVPKELTPRKKAYENLRCAFILSLAFWCPLSFSLCVGSGTMNPNIALFFGKVFGFTILFELIMLIALKILGHLVELEEDAEAKAEDNKEQKAVEDPEEVKLKELKKAVDRASYELRKNLRALYENDPDKN